MTSTDSLLTKSSSKIKVCIIGIGNCASALIQGVTKSKYETLEGITFEDIGGYKVSDIDFVGAYDVDERKVGFSLNDAIYAKPNCCYNIFDCKQDNDLKKVIVSLAPRFDGIASHMLKEPKDISFRPLPDNWDSAKFVSEITAMKPDVLINYLPVGSQLATEFWANMCLFMKIPFLNCIPVFIASNPVWEQQFIDKGIPLIGDDMRSQFGASVVSQMLEELALDRGHTVLCHIQQNSGGNTDFLNMSDKSRLVSKKISKENVLRASHEIKNVEMDKSYFHAGPSEYIEYYGDKKVANFTLELKGFGGAPVKFDAKLSVEDSPNSAGVVVDSIRFLMVAKELGLKGSLRGASAFTQKSPPEQLLFKDAFFECNELAQRRLTDKTLKQLI